MVPIAPYLFKEEKTARFQTHAFIFALDIDVKMWDITSYSPLRISLVGGGTDIPPYIDTHGSSVINTTIDRGVSLRYRYDHEPLEISSRDYFRSSVGGARRSRTGISGQIADLFAEFGIDKGRVLINSDVPPGSGLGSSSALILAALNLIHSIRGETISRKDLAESAYRLEKDTFHIMLGKQDPYSIAFGGFKHLEFKNGGYNINYFDPKSDFVKRLESSMLIVYTGKTRESSAILQDQVRRSERNEKNTIGSLDRLLSLSYEMKTAMENSDFNRVCSLVNRGWEIKKTLGTKVTNDRVEKIISAALSNGGKAARLLGGGSQGFVLVLSDSPLIELQRKMLLHSKFVVRVSFDTDGTRVVTPAGQ